MHTIDLNIHGGGELEVHGSLSAGRIIVLLSRENFRLDDPLVTRLVEYFTAGGGTVVRYQSQAVVTLRLIDRKGFDRLPHWLRQTVKGLLLLLHPGRWRHFSARHRVAINSIPYRVQSLRELVRFLGPDKELVFLTRSAGGRVTSLVADEAGIGKLVCLGYPFRHPDESPEPERYAHLARLRTPLLIVQGTRDSYGGREEVGQCHFAPRTRIEWVETGHDFTLSEEQWRTVLQQIEGFIEETGDEDEQHDPADDGAR